MKEKIALGFCSWFGSVGFLQLFQKPQSALVPCCFRHPTKPPGTGAAQSEFILRAEHQGLMGPWFLFYLSSDKTPPTNTVGKNEEEKLKLPGF